MAMFGKRSEGLQRPSEECESFLEDVKSQKSPGQVRMGVNWMIVSWMLSGALACICLIQFFQAQRSIQFGRYDTGFLTEFGPEPGQFQLQRVRFWGSSRWHDNGTGFIIRNPDEPRYTGLPSAEVDAAWQDLLRPGFISLTEQETTGLWGQNHGLSNSPSLGFAEEPSVLLALRCVDQLRMALDHEHYYSVEHPLPHRDHRDHCLDQLRQLLMCHADLTPMPLIYYPGIDLDVVNTDQFHTCRNWKMVRQWLDSRDFQTRKVVKANLGRMRHGSSRQ